MIGRRCMRRCISEFMEYGKEVRGLLICDRHLKPGGYIEQVENSIHVKCDDGTLSPNGPLKRLGKVRLVGQCFLLDDFPFPFSSTVILSQPYFIFIPV